MMNQTNPQNNIVRQLFYRGTSESDAQSISSLLDSAPLKFDLKAKVCYIGIAAKERGDVPQMFPHAVEHSRFGGQGFNGLKSHELACPWDGTPARPGGLTSIKWDWGRSKAAIVIGVLVTVVAVALAIGATTGGLGEQFAGIGSGIDIFLVWIVISGFILRHVRVVARITLSLTKDWTGEDFEPHPFGGDPSARLEAFERVFPPAKRHEYDLYLSIPRGAFPKFRQSIDEAIKTKLTLKEMRIGNIEKFPDNEGICYVPDKAAAVRLRVTGIGGGMLNDVAVIALLALSIAVIAIFGSFFSGWMLELSNYTGMMLPFILVSLALYFVVLTPALGMAALPIAYWLGLDRGNDPLWPVRHKVEILPTGTSKWIGIFSSQYRAVAAEVYNLVQRDIRGDPPEVNW